MKNLNMLSRTIFLIDLDKLCDVELSEYAAKFAWVMMDEMRIQGITTLLSDMYCVRPGSKGAILFRSSVVRCEPKLYCAIANSIVPNIHIEYATHSTTEGAYWFPNPLRIDVVAFLSDAELILKTLNQMSLEF